MSEFRGGLVFDILRNLKVPVLIRASFMKRFIKSIFPFKRILFSHNSKQVPKIAINDQSEKHEGKGDKTQDLLLLKEERSQRLVHVNGKKYSVKIRKDCISRDRSERATTDSKATSTGQYLSMDDSYGQH